MAESATAVSSYYMYIKSITNYVEMALFKQIIRIVANVSNIAASQQD